MIEIPQKLNLSRIASDRIKAYITDNNLEAGSKLPSEKQFVEMLNVSRTVVREALKSLETLGIVKIKSGDGIYVNTISLKPVIDQVSFQWKENKKRMKELLATRRILELGAIEMAVEEYNLDIIDQMESCNRRMEEKMRKKQSSIDEDIEFHRLLFQATANETYYELSEVITEFFTAIREVHLSQAAALKQSLQEHSNIVRFIREKETDQAKQEMEKHLRPLRQYIDA